MRAPDKEPPERGKKFAVMNPLVVNVCEGSFISVAVLEVIFPATERVEESVHGPVTEIRVPWSAMEDGETTESVP